MKFFTAILNALDGTLDEGIRLYQRFSNVNLGLMSPAELGGLPTIKRYLSYLSWSLIAIAMLLIISIAHFYGFETLETEILILLLLIGVRYSARAGL